MTTMTSAALKSFNPPRFSGNSSHCGNNPSAAPVLSQSLEKKGGSVNQEIVKKNDIDKYELSLIEQVVMQGDLSKLNAEQRVTYYRKVCESAGLNPFTRPFDYIILNGKLTLYAKKDCTEQLRKLNGISIDSIEEKIVGDLFIVKAKARTRDGRTDESTGAVTIKNLKGIGNLQGDALANALMKAETKAKRRVTLSISGMGWTDETEIETIPSAVKVDVDLATGEITNQTKSKPAKTKISLEQAEELETIISECDESYKKWALSFLLDKYEISSLKDLPTDLYTKVKDGFLKNMEANHQRQREQFAQESQNLIAEEVQ